MLNFTSSVLIFTDGRRAQPLSCLPENGRTRRTVFENLPFFISGAMGGDRGQGSQGNKQGFQKTFQTILKAAVNGCLSLWYTNELNWSSGIHDSFVHLEEDRFNPRTQYTCMVPMPGSIPRLGWIHSGIVLFNC